MKNRMKLSAAAFAAVMAMSAMTASASAKVWLGVENGITYRYSQEEGSCVQDATEYTGWARSSSGERYYYKNGKRLKSTWLSVSGEKMYYLDKKGRMLRDTSITRGGATYWFDRNGRVMDDNVSEWGITGEAKYMKTREGMSISISRDKSADANEVTWGEEFRIERLGEDGVWSALPYKTDEIGWDDVASYVEAGKSTDRWCDWSYMYGSLEDGSYRLVKALTRKVPGKSYTRSKLLYIEFDIDEKTGHYLYNPPEMTVNGVRADGANSSWWCVYPDGQGTEAEACGLGPLDEDAVMPVIKATAGEMLPLGFSFTKAPAEFLGLYYTENPYEIKAQSWDYSERGNDSAKSDDVPVKEQSIKAVSGKHIYQVTAKWTYPERKDSTGTMGGTVNYYFAVEAD